MFPVNALKNSMATIFSNNVQTTAPPLLPPTMTVGSSTKPPVYKATSINPLSEMKPASFQPTPPFNVGQNLQFSQLSGQALPGNSRLDAQLALGILNESLDKVRAEDWSEIQPDHKKKKK